MVNELWGRRVPPVSNPERDGPFWFYVKKIAIDGDVTVSVDSNRRLFPTKSIGDKAEIASEYFSCPYTLIQELAFESDLHFGWVRGVLAPKDRIVPYTA